MSKPHYVAKALHLNKKGSTAVGAGWKQRENDNVSLVFDIPVVVDRLWIAPRQGEEGSELLARHAREDTKPSFVFSIPKRGEGGYSSAVGAGWVQTNDDGEYYISVRLDFPVCLERAFLNVKSFD